MMGKSKEAKWKEDVGDAQAIFDDLVRFSKMTIHDVKAYVEKNPNQLSWLELESGRSLHMSGQSGNRFWSMTDRQIQIDPSGDVDRATLNQAIRHEFAKSFVEVNGQIQRSSVDRMLARASKRARLTHRAKTHYLPCVIVGDHDPREFRVGPVRFIHRDKFFGDYGEQIERDLAEQAAEQRESLKRLAEEKKHVQVPSEEDWERTNQTTLKMITGYYKEYRWVAEVTVPPCDARVSRQRAELVVQAALDLLKIFFGSSYAKGLRLATGPGVAEKSADLVREDDGNFEWVLHFGGEWALADDGWFDQISEMYADELSAAGQAIATYLSGSEPKELTTRWLDALHWYGQGVSERVTSAQIVKYVAALERISITERTKTDGQRGLTDAVSRRAALFATGGDPQALEKARIKARELYDWRSSLMHGRNSPISKQQLRSNEMKTAKYETEELLRSALFGALAVYANLILDGKSTGRDLEQRLRELEKATGLVAPNNANVPQVAANLIAAVRSANRSLQRFVCRAVHGVGRRKGSGRD